MVFFPSSTPGVGCRPTVVKAASFPDSLRVILECSLVNHVQALNLGFQRRDVYAMVNDFKAGSLEDNSR